MNDVIIKIVNNKFPDNFGNVKKVNQELKMAWTGNINFFKRKRSLCIDASNIFKRSAHKFDINAVWIFVRYDLGVNVADIHDLSTHTLKNGNFFIKFKEQGAFDEALDKLTRGIVWPKYNTTVNGHSCEKPQLMLQVRNVFAEVPVEEVKAALSEFANVHYIRKNIYRQFAPEHEVFDGSVMARVTPFAPVPPYLYRVGTVAMDANVWQVSYHGQEKPGCYICGEHSHISYKCPNKEQRRQLYANAARNGRTEQGPRGTEEEEEDTVPPGEEEENVPPATEDAAASAGVPGEGEVNEPLLQPGAVNEIEQVPAAAGDGPAAAGGGLAAAASGPAPAGDGPAAVGDGLVAAGDGPHAAKGPVNVPVPPDAAKVPVGEVKKSVPPGVAVVPVKTGSPPAKEQVKEPVKVSVEDSPLAVIDREKRKASETETETEFEDPLKRAKHSGDDIDKMDINEMPPPAIGEKTVIKAKPFSPESSGEDEGKEAGKTSLGGTPSLRSLQARFFGKKT